LVRKVDTTHVKTETVTVTRLVMHLDAVEDLVHHLNAFVLEVHLFHLELFHLVGHDGVQRDHHNHHTHTCTPSIHNSFV